MLRVRASENVAVKPIPLDDYGCDAHRHDDVGVDERSLNARVRDYVGLEIVQIKNDTNSIG